MTKWSLILASALGLLQSSNVLASGDDTESPSSTLNLEGFVAGTYFDSKNVLPFDTHEIGLSASYTLTPNVSLFASVHGNQIRTDIADALVRVNFPIPRTTWETDISMGRNKNYFFLYNHDRSTPSARNNIVMPQSMYWKLMDDIGSSSDGLSMTLRSHSGIDLSYTVGKLTLHDPKQVNKAAFFDGNLSRSGDMNSLRVSSRTSSTEIGAQFIRWNIYSDITGHEYLHAKAIFGKYYTSQYSVSAEFLTVHKRKGVNDVDSLSLTYSRAMTDKLTWTLNSSITTNNNPILDMIYPGKNYSTDFNTSLRYRVNSKLDVKVEYHIVRGTTWIDMDKNPNPSVSDRITAVQLIYSF